MKNLPLKNKSIGTLGPALSFHDLVLKEHFEGSSPVYFKNFESIFQALELGEIDAALVATSNSIYGPIKENRNNIAKYNYTETVSYDLVIALHLAALNAIPLHQIEVIYANDIAWNECAYFLKNLKVKQIRSTSNAQAVIDLLSSTNKNAAAISGAKSISHYNLTTLSSNIEDHENNITTFSCIVKK